jgi:hypothetical protein
MKKGKNSLRPSCLNVVGLTLRIVNMDNSNEEKTVKKNWDIPQALYSNNVVLTSCTITLRIGRLYNKFFDRQEILYNNAGCPITISINRVQ